MKKKFTLGILLAALVIAVSVAAYRMSVVPKPTFVNEIVKTVVSPVVDEPSPYSIKWGAAMARVVDQDGNGVADATVTFKKSLRRDCDGNIIEQPPEWQGTSVTTDETGEFTYPPEIWQTEEAEKKPSININIEAQGFLPRRGAHVGVNYAEDNGEIDLFRVGRIEGAIIDPNGQPLANVPLWFNTQTYYKNPSVSCGGCFSANIKTDEAGGFVFEKVPPGQHIIKFPGYAGGCGQDEPVEIIPFKEYATFQILNMKDGEVKTNVFLDLRQQRGTIKGKIVDTYNRPMADVNADLYRVIKQYFADGGGWSSSTWNLKSAQTDENGHYTLNSVPPGDYQLKASYPYEKGKNYKSGDPLNIYLAGTQEVTFNLVLERQDDSLPKPDCRNESPFGVPLPDDLGPRDMMIVDPRGNPIPNANVVFESPIKIEDKKTHQRTEKQWDGATLAADERGVVTMPEELDPVEGKWVQCYLKIDADGFHKRHLGWFRTSHLEDDPRIDILPVSNIQGRLIGTDGKPVKGRVEYRDRVIAFKHPSSEQSGGGYSFLNTDARGGFMLEDVPEGTHVIHYTVDDAKTEILRTGATIVYTQGGQDVNDLVIDLRQDTCVVRGRVLDWDGKPIKKASVRLLKTVQAGYRGTMTTWPEFYRSEETNRKGEYIIENIRPGIYEIEAVLEGDRRRTSEKMTIALGEDQAIEIDVRLKR